MKTLVFLFALLCSPLLAAPVPIFDGQTLAGWDYDPAIWRVEDGLITGGSTTEKIKANYFICTKQSYANFELRMKIKCSGDPATGLINSGIQIRSVRVPGGAHMSGYQVDCGAGWFGKIYDEARRNRVIATPVDQAALDKVVEVFGWNEYLIRAEGPRIQAWINGVLALDYTEADKNIALDGQLGPQVHSGGVCLVQVKDVTIEELPPTPGAPTWKSLGGVEAARAKVAPPKQGAGAPPPPVNPPKKPGTDAAGQTGPEKRAAQTAITTGPRSPEEERAAFKLPEGFEAELVAAEDPANGIGKFVPIAFDQKGALWTTTALEYPVDGNENPAAADALYASKAKDKVLVYNRDPKSPTGYASQPRVFMDGLAIPLGVLPYKDGCYVLHGHNIVFAEDTNGDGKSDKSTVILSGFGVNDSHLFPHQFMRAPGGWIWLAQGLFNRSAVKTSDGKTVEFDMCRMAKFRPDGTQFEATSVGPNNIWGLVLNGEGEAFIQEANDYGYPVMPFHEYAYYPGGAERLAKSYQPPFPHTADFRMGGTGLSGLALADQSSVFSLQYSDHGGVNAAQVAPLNPEHRILNTDTQVVFVANPITNRIQAIKMHRDGPRWRLELLPDFLVSSDPWFRPVAITIGPDGCLYIVDWYNKIISHNEVPRNHPDRDKTRGRIWRVKAKAAKPLDVPDFTKLNGDELIAKLGGESLAQSHLAWQAIGDRGMKELTEKLGLIVEDGKHNDAARAQALWALEGIQTAQPDRKMLEALLVLPNRNLRREAATAIGSRLEYADAQLILREMVNDEPEVRGAAIRQLGKIMDELFSPDVAKASGRLNVPPAKSTGHTSTVNYDAILAIMAPEAISDLLAFVREPLVEPVAPSTRNGKPIKVREAYDREFERYLVRMFLEQQPDAVAKFLDSDAAKPLPVEARLLASLALEPKASAARVAKLLPQLQRAPGQEEVLRLAQFPDEPGVGEALRAALNNPATRTGVLEALLATRTRLDSAKLTPLLADAAKQLLAGSDAAGVQLGIQLAGAFQLTGVEETLVALLERGAHAPRVSGEAPRLADPNASSGRSPNDVSGGAPETAREARALPILRALRDLGSTQSELFSRLIATTKDPQLRDEAVLALASSKAPDTGERLLKLWPELQPAQRRSALDRLAGTRPGAKTIVSAIRTGTMKKDELDGPTVEKLQAVLGQNPDLTALLGELASLFRPVLLLNGQEDAWTETGVTLDGPFTVECWVRLDPGSAGRTGIGNADGILGVPGQLDLNFFGGKFRVWAGGTIRDAIVSKKPITENLWTHVAATRDEKGMFRLYQDGELVADESKPVTAKFENVRIGWTGAKGGSAGALDEFRLWNRVRTPDEIRRDFDRTFEPNAKPNGLVFTGWGKLQPGAKLAKTSDFPPVMSVAEAAALDAKFAKYRTLALQPGDAARGKNTAALCQACHLFKGQGGAIGPDLSGVGAMGTEAILRNILTPNAAMENGYRIYRVELKTGDVVDAFFVSEDKEAVVIRAPGAPDRRIAREEIAKTQYLRRSLMPEGLLDVLPAEQVRDLFAYLLSLK